MRSDRSPWARTLGAGVAPDPGPKVPAQAPDRPALASRRRPPGPRGPGEPPERAEGPAGSTATTVVSVMSLGVVLLATALPAT
ncbi:predicted protein [Streptomyces lividans TK24]|nr:predicted protein [Streptomyces lividans TK24]